MASINMPGEIANESPAGDSIQRAQDTLNLTTTRQQRMNKYCSGTQVLEQSESPRRSRPERLERHESLRKDDQRLRSNTSAGPEDVTGPAGEGG